MTKNQIPRLLQINATGVSSGVGLLKTVNALDQVWWRATKMLEHVTYEEKMKDWFVQSLEEKVKVWILLLTSTTQWVVVEK